jgi:hypothetical protein
MVAYTNPGFQERTALAQQARQKALDQLRAKPPVDEAVLAERNAARLVREQAEAEARAARHAAREQAKADKRAKASEAAVAPAAPTEEERRIARDARYAARKQRKASR